ncbi:MAG TPA: HD domain-containing protein [Thermoleophilaceae bacterium]|nr:HD domain-containing protein [Thermoleophilaceae bacterium]
MEQTTLTATKAFVRDLQDGQEVDSVFVVQELARRQKRNGEPFLKLWLGDASGRVEAVVWDGIDEVAGCAAPGAVVRTKGNYAIDPRYGGCLTVRAMRAANEGEYEPADLAEGPPIAYREMAAALDELIGTVRQPHLRELLARLIDPRTEIGRRWHEAPAAKHYHQAYRHGLLEHCLSVAQGVHALAAGPFPDVDHDIAVTGALLHDIGKVEAYAMANGAIDLTDSGKLLGEIPLGYFIVRREIERIEGFPAECAQAVLHIILSHHGKLEHGSPVVPCTREAALVHMIDNLGGTLGSFDRLERALADGERWSAFDRGISSAAYFGRAERDDAREAA